MNMSDKDPSRLNSGMMSVPASNLNVVSALNLNEDDLPAGMVSLYYTYLIFHLEISRLLGY